MGNRALVQFTDDDGDISPVTYFHWAGGDVPDMIRECAVLMEGSGTPDYAAARFVGIANRRMPGNMSLGLWNHGTLLTAEDSHGDQGCFIVNCSTWEVTATGGKGRSFNAMPTVDENGMLPDEEPEHPPYPDDPRVAQAMGEAVGPDNQPS